MTAQATCKSAEHYTPPEIAKILRDTVGVFDLDAFSNERANAYSIMARHFYDGSSPARDGFLARWLPLTYANYPGNADGSNARKAWRKAVTSGATIVWAQFAVNSGLTLQSWARAHGLEGPLDFPTWWPDSRCPGTNNSGRICWIAGWIARRQTDMFADQFINDVVPLPATSPPAGSFFSLIRGTNWQVEQWHRLARYGQVLAPSVMRMVS